MPAREKPTDYKTAVEYLFSKHRMDLPYGLEKITSFLEEIGNPHLKLRGAIVTGSKGKGSTTAMLHSILRAAGLRVGRLTSPHLVRFNERIVVDREIDDQKVAELVERFYTMIEAREAKGPDHTLTFFEITTAMAFQHFADAGCDLVVLEVGMGGRLDATNVMRNNVSVITPIELEHAKVLGSTVELIAKEKAGVIKEIPGRGARVLTSTSGEALEVIKARAREVQAFLTVVGEDVGEEEWTEYVGVTRHGYSPVAGQFFSTVVRCGCGPGATTTGMSGLQIPLHGVHEVENAALAIEAARDCAALLSVELDDAAIRKGLASVVWPARIQFVRHPPVAPLVLDCAHTVGSASALVRTLKELTPGTKYNIVIGLLQDKDARGVFSTLQPIAEKFHLCPVKSARAAKEEDLVAVLGQLGAAFDSHSSLSEAVDCAEKGARPHRGTLICGSVYLAGEAMELLGLANQPIDFGGERR